MSMMEIYLLMTLISAVWGFLLGTEIGRQFGGLAWLGCGALGAVIAVTLFLCTTWIFEWFGNAASKIWKRNRVLGASLLVVYIVLAIACIGSWLALTARLSHFSGH